MKDLICLVTGATSGIGEVTAEALARAGATVVVVGRNPAKTEALVARLVADTGNPKVEAIIGDLSLQADVRQVAAAFRARHDRLDRLINNAGAMFTERRLTADGFEQTWALNHLAYFLLTALLRPTLEATPGARVVSTASDGHRIGKLAWDDLQFETRAYGSGTAAYCQSKLANVVFTRELARQLEGTGVVANCVHPGYVASGFALNNGPLVRFGQWLGKPFARTVDKGAETVIWAAMAPEAGALNGQYLVDTRVKQPSKRARDAESGRRLWALSEAQVGGSAV